MLNLIRKGLFYVPCTLDLQPHIHRWSCAVCTFEFYHMYRCPVPSDTDSIETASLTSQSSAYFSLTPTLGSVTELSDTTSIESFNEYDFKGKNGVSITCVHCMLFLNTAVTCDVHPHIIYKLNSVGAYCSSPFSV